MQLILSGGAQSCIIGPLLFNIYVSDSAAIITNATFVIFANGTILRFVGNMMDDVIASENKDLLNMNVSTESNTLKMNTSKSKAVLPCPKHKAVNVANKPVLNSNGIEIMGRLKSLGVTLFFQMLEGHHTI